MGNIKSILSLLILIIFQLSLVSADVLLEFHLNRNQVYAEGYTCHNCDPNGNPTWCSANKVVDRSPFGFNPSEPAATNGIVTVPYKNWNTLQTQSGDSGTTCQFTYFFTPGYLSITNAMNVNPPCSNCGPYPINFNFEKVNNCKSEVGNIIYSNNIYNDQPIVVSVPADLSADTSAAFGCKTCRVRWIPTKYIDYFSALTNVKLTIKNSAGTVVNNPQTVQKNILWDSTVTVNFDQWYPPAEDTYTVRVETDVVDDQCASSELDWATNTVTVWPYYPKNECWTHLDGLKVIDQGTTKLVNEPLTIEYQKRSHYAPNYDPWDSSYNTYKAKVPTRVKVYLGYGDSSVIWVEQESVLVQPSGAWGDDEVKQLTFTPTIAGTELKIRVEAVAEDSKCVGKTNPSESAEVDIDIRECDNGDTQNCYSGPSGTQNVGLCIGGTQTCTNYEWGSCQGEVVPSAEVCDALLKDENCDGASNPSSLCDCNEGETQLCSVEHIGICAVGTESCTNGKWGGCPLPKSDEGCNDIDDRCNGMEDEDWYSYYLDSDGDGHGDETISTEACTEPVGYAIIDINSNQKDCDDTTDTISPSATENCMDPNCVDEDCDGLPNAKDESCTDENSWFCTCDTGFTWCEGGKCANIIEDVKNCGACGNSCIDGVQIETYETAECLASKCEYKCLPNLYDIDEDLSNGCEYQCAPSEDPTEICDGVDNNCDGTIDEGFPNVCVTGCTPSADPTEVCDGIDNNCDGTTDEGFDGICTIGCVYEGAEICDAKDNNCNGVIDEGFDDDLDTYCKDIDCNDKDELINPGQNEICDGKDNNCNDEIDEICDMDKDGYCGSDYELFDGITICPIDKKDCNDGDSSIHPGAVDICFDNEDNDCNSWVDDGDNCGCEDGDTKPCGDTDKGECAYGIKTCSGGTWSECVGEKTPTDEVCDKYDNDCDGVTNNGIDCCEQGDSLVCVPDSDKCTNGIRYCQNYGWGDCLAQCKFTITLMEPQNKEYTTKSISVEYALSQGANCRYELQKPNSILKKQGDIEPNQLIEAYEGENEFKLICDEKEVDVKFSIRTEFVEYIITPENIDDLMIEIEDSNFSTQIIVENLEQSQDAIDSEISTAFDDGKTTIT
ncbi:hypothetical protein HN451_09090, partial [archaeon]|nr:hypothetical protein [archaeon]